MRLKWRRQHTFPWGRPIGYYDVAFLSINGKAYEIRKFFNASGRVTHYALARYTLGSKPATFKTIKQAIESVRRGKPSPCS